jgi:hypothetical protein
VNVDADEADIRHVSGGAFATAVGMETADVLVGNSELGIVNSERGAAGANSGSAIGRWLILAALGLFLLETLLARLFSVYR